jgi:hypothetical protein
VLSDNQRIVYRVLGLIFHIMHIFYITWVSVNDHLVSVLAALRKQTENLIRLNYFNGNCVNKKMNLNFIVISCYGTTRHRFIHSQNVRIHFWNVLFTKLYLANFNQILSAHIAMCPIAFECYLVKHFFCIEKPALLVAIMLSWWSNFCYFSLLFLYNLLG